MPSQETSLSDSEGPSSKSVSAYVPSVIADEISRDAAADDRSESYIIGKILSAHYAPRIEKRARHLKRAA